MTNMISYQGLVRTFPNSLTKQKPWEVLGMSRAKWYRLGKPSGSETTPSPITCHGQMAAKSA
ncbi:TPA: hypothetical protein ACPZS9_004485, partial [Yersinia enterocolitica]